MTSWWGSDGWKVSLSFTNQNRFCMVLTGGSLLHNYLPLNAVKLNTFQFFNHWQNKIRHENLEGKGPKTCLAFGIYKKENHDCLFCVQTNISFCAQWKFKCLLLCVCVCVCFLSKDAWCEAACWAHRSIHNSLLTKICWWAKDARTKNKPPPRPTWRNPSHL